MTILVTGATGMVGKQVLAHLAAARNESGESGTNADMDIRALTRHPEKAVFDDHVLAVKGDLADVDSIRQALQDVTTLFLLAPNSADELTQVLQTLSVARERKVKGIVYLSVFKGADYVDVPHFTGKHAAERMIEGCGMAATILRPAYFMQNDARQKSPLLDHGVYGMPIGSVGISMVDVRDIGEAAARELLRRERAAVPQASVSYDLVGPNALTAETITRIWSDALGRSISYGGDDLDMLEQRMRTVAPAWLAYDMRLMMQRYQQDGAVASEAEVDKLTRLLGRPPCSYAAFAKETAASWLV